jgi:hypothetical protein
MTRLARVVFGLPHHVTQHGNRREPIFFEDGDQEIYRGLLREQVRGRRSFTTCAVSSLLRQVSVGEGVPLPRRIQAVHGTVPQKCARNALPAPSDILSRPALRELRCHPLPTSSTRAPEVTPN